MSTLPEVDHPAIRRRLSTPRLRAAGASPVAALALAAGLVIGSSVVIALVTPHVPAQSAGMFYLVAVLAASSIYGVGWGLAVSLASALAYNFFFLPPRHTLVISSSSDWLALGVFVATAVVTSNLAARARRERDEAARRAAEAELGTRFATLVAQTSDLESVLPELAALAAAALGAGGGTLIRGEAPPPDAGAHVIPLLLSGERVGELRLTDAPDRIEDDPSAGRIAGNLAGLIALAEERERRLRERVQTQALSRSNELKTALLRAVSHDLRTPLQAITAAAGGLRYAGLDDEELELVQTISDQGASMSRMVENLLDLSRMQAGVLGPTADWLDPRELVEAAADRWPAGPAGRLRLDLPHDIPLIRADAAQLDRVLVNLIENALKFSAPDAPVDVVLDATSADVRVSVLDRGPGVDPAEAADIFEPFVRGSAARRVNGSGLGLAIARGLAEANAGRLEVAARDGGGSTFTLTLPRDGAAE